MSDTTQFRIDSHKLHLHPQRVADWLAGKDIAPIYMEISPSGACNHRCSFCGLDFMEYKPRFLPLDIMQERFAEMGKLGVKAVMFAGEGEPFLHKDMAALTEAAKNAGIDTAFTTNGVLLKPETARRILPLTSWIKVSCNAGTPETYARVHGTKAEDFSTVMQNLAEAVRLREELGSSCTLGFQMVLLPENRHEAVELAHRVRDLGADYLVIKPYSRHPQSHKSAYASLAYDEADTLSEALSHVCTATFNVVYRHEAMARYSNVSHDYTRCLALPFWGYVDSAGNMWTCLRHIGEKAYFGGSLIQESAEKILLGQIRISNMAYCEHNLSVENCHVDCRMDVINRYLWELKRPHGHKNFI